MLQEDVGIVSRQALNRNKNGHLLLHANGHSFEFFGKNNASKSCLLHN